MHSNAPQHKQKGFSLIEALVAFLILSVGMLGIASLQVVSLKAGQTAAFRTVAVIKAAEILEMMRSNRTVLLAYGATPGGIDHGCDDYSGSPKLCSATQLAQDQVFKWHQGLKEALPDDVTTSATLNYTSPTAAQPLSQVEVTINWRERNPDANDMIDMSYSTSSMMLCTGGPGQC